MKSLNSHDLRGKLINGLVSVDDAVALIRADASLAIAGPEAALDRLPAGNWIGGTICHIMTEDGGRVIGDDEVFVTDLSAIGEMSVACYDAGSLASISAESPEHGFALAILPAMSTCHERFALEAPFYPDSFLKPTIGWIAGYDLDAGGQAHVYDGRGPHKHDDRAVAARVAWDAQTLAIPDIVNPFQPGHSDTIAFENPGFRQTHCLIEGQRVPLADYLRDHGLQDGRLPLVGDYAGARINVSLQSIGEDGTVTFYAPVFPDVDYHVAAPIDDYPAAFRAELDRKHSDDTIWSCNCILNFLFGDLEGRSVGGVAGPVTFGEIAYQLLNQTMVRLRRIA